MPVSTTADCLGEPEAFSAPVEAALVAMAPEVEPTDSAWAGSVVDPTPAAAIPAVSMAAEAVVRTELQFAGGN